MPRPSTAERRPRDRVPDGQPRFWGREPELARFRAVLAHRPASLAVLFLHGIGGVGKSALLREYAKIAHARGATIAQLDGRLIDPSPGGFHLALQDALGRGADSAAPALDGVDDLVLFVDSYELLTPLDDWLRRVLLPGLPHGAVVVVAGRNPPGADWITDLEIGPWVQTIALRNLQAAASLALLSARRVPGAQQPAVLEFTHGHPLALVLVAEVVAATGADLRFAPEQAPQVVRLLLERIVAAAPDEARRRALELSAHVRVTNEALVASVIGGCDVHAVFDWLRGLSFMEQGPEGVFPHDIVRAAIDADFRWRDPDGYKRLHERVWESLRYRLTYEAGRARQRAFFDKLYLHRFNEIGARYHDYGTLGSLFAEPAGPDDHAAIVQAVRHHEGAASSRIAAHWLTRQPEAFQVLHGAGGGLLGFVATLDLTSCSVEDVEIDPAVNAALAFARLNGPLRPGEVILHHRFHVACDVYQDLSPTINLLALRVTIAPLQEARLAWSFITFADSERWQPIMRYLNFQPAREAGFEVAARPFTVFAHDWRRETFDDWWRREAQRSLAPEDDADPGRDAGAPLVVLSESDFSRAVRSALRDYHRPGGLSDNPLLRSRALVDAAGQRPTVDDLRALLRGAIERLKAAGRDEKFHRAIWHTYIQPAASQERAAERLGVPFSTYRYQLARATERVAEWLWQCELHGPAPDDGAGRLEDSPR